MIEYVSFEAFLGLSWAFALLALVLSIGRFWIRSTIIKQIGWDDAAHLLGLLFLLALVSLMSGLTSMIDQPRPEDPPRIARSKVALFLRINATCIIVLWCCLYSIKVAFLLLYRHIFRISKAFTRAWWIVSALTFVAFWISIAGTLTQCGSAANLDDADKCRYFAMIRRQRDLVIYSAVMNIVSDVAIMALPLAMLKGLNMHLGAKICLAVVFCCASITIVFEILRTMDTLDMHSLAGAVSLWTNLESSLAVIMSCLPSLVALRSSRKQRSTGRKAIHFQPRSLIVSESAKLHIKDQTFPDAEDDGSISATENT